MENITYNGINYRYDNETGELFAFPHLLVAHIEWAKDSNFDEYNYFVDDESEEVMSSLRENHEVDFGKMLIGQYVEFNQ